MPTCHWIEAWTCPPCCRQRSGHGNSGLSPAFCRLVIGQSPRLGTQQRCGVQLAIFNDDGRLAVPLTGNRPVGDSSRESTCRRAIVDGGWATASTQSACRLRALSDSPRPGYLVPQRAYIAKFKVDACAPTGCVLRRYCVALAGTRPCLVSFQHENHGPMAGNWPVSVLYTYVPIHTSESIALSRPLVLPSVCCCFEDCVIQTTAGSPPPQQQQTASGNTVTITTFTLLLSRRGPHTSGKNSIDCHV